MSVRSSLRVVKRRLRGAKRSGELFARTLHREHRVFLTFDDGPTEHTQAILDLLSAYNAKATFFLIGENVTPESTTLMAQALNDGHSIGSHTWSHADLPTCTPEQIAHEIRSADYVLTRIYEEAGRDPSAGPRLFRFPYLRTGDRKQRRVAYDTLGQLGYQVYFCDVDPQDWKLPLGTIELDEVVRRASEAKMGDVVVLHETEFAVPLLKRILPTLADSYDLCSLDARNGYGEQKSPRTAAA